MVTSEERKLRKKNKKLKRQLRKYKQKYKLARGASRQASNKTPHEELIAKLRKTTQDTQDRMAENQITNAADLARARRMARDREADSRDSEAMRRGAIDATEFAKRAEARREQRRIELDAVDKTRDADLAASTYTATVPSTTFASSPTTLPSRMNPFLSRGGSKRLGAVPQYLS